MHIPAGLDDLAIRKRLLTEFGIEIGGGLGRFQRKGLAHRPDGIQQQIECGVPGPGGKRWKCAWRCKAGVGVAAAEMAYSA